MRLQKRKKIIRTNLDNGVIRFIFTYLGIKIHFYHVSSHIYILMIVDRKGGQLELKSCINPLNNNEYDKQKSFFA
ncbi:hypothetical protein EZS27_029841 [termite gut metagenome]|uniref:Uncharacterized protein n=1 Tax=termite gut metagenome TaxID=433724 RepID=A0A5J4QH76_9ZZZZ